MIMFKCTVPLFLVFNLFYIETELKSISTSNQYSSSASIISDHPYLYKKFNYLKLNLSKPIPMPNQIHCKSPYPCKSIKYLKNIIDNSTNKINQDETFNENKKKADDMINALEQDTFDKSIKNTFIEFKGKLNDQPVNKVKLLIDRLFNLMNHLEYHDILIDADKIYTEADNIKNGLMEKFKENIDIIMIDLKRMENKILFNDQMNLDKNYFETVHQLSSELKVLIKNKERLNNVLKVMEKANEKKNSLIEIFKERINELMIKLNKNDQVNHCLKGDNDTINDFFKKQQTSIDSLEVLTKNAEKINKILEEENELKEKEIDQDLFSILKRKIDEIKNIKLSKDNFDKKILYIDNQFKLDEVLDEMQPLIDRSNLLMDNIDQINGIFEPIKQDFNKTDKYQSQSFKQMAQSIFNTSENLFNLMLDHFTNLDDLKPNLQQIVDLLKTFFKNADCVDKLFKVKKVDELFKKFNEIISKTKNSLFKNELNIRYYKLKELMFDQFNIESDINSSLEQLKLFTNNSDQLESELKQADDTVSSVHESEIIKMTSKLLSLVETIISQIESTISMVDSANKISQLKKDTSESVKKLELIMEYQIQLATLYENATVVIDKAQIIMNQSNDDKVKKYIKDKIDSIQKEMHNLENFNSENNLFNFLRVMRKMIKDLDEYLKHPIKPTTTTTTPKTPTTTTPKTTTTTTTKPTTKKFQIMNSEYQLIH